MNIENILTAILAISTAILGWMQLRAEWMRLRSEAMKKKTESKVDDADATKKIGEAYSGLISAMNERIDNM